MTTGAGGQQILMDPKMGVIAEEEDGIQVLFGFQLLSYSTIKVSPSVTT